MAEIIVSVVAKVAKYLAFPVGRPIRFIWNYSSNFDILKKEVEKLESKRDTVQHSVEAATTNGEEIEQHVNIWLERVETMIAEASEVIRESEQARMKCLKGLCSNPKKHYQQSRKAAKKGKAVAELRGEGKFTTVSYVTIPKEIWIPAHKDYEDFESRMSIFENIRDELNNPEVNMIGIYGTGGIGKTTLARKVAAHAEDNKLFNVVAFAEVTMKPVVKEIQQEIADKLGLTFREESNSGRARSLQQRLMQEDKVFLILDNIWEGLKLEDVGIPFGNDHKGCKVLLTARSSDVLSKMNSQSNFKINFIDEEETWSLFKKKAGPCIENDEHIQALAIEVAKALGGLPIAITSVAVALKGKGVSVWKDALNELKRPSARSFEGVAAETYASIEISYNQLRRKELKSIFLLCSIMGYTSIEDLLAYGMGLGMLKGTQTIEEARNRVIASVQQLKGSSLLLDANNERFFLHDVVRDVARSIASRDGHMIVETGNVIPRELIDKNVLRKCNQISLHAISELPMQLECPELEFFYMKSKKKFLKVPDKFFTRMPELKVLHLAGLNLNLVSNSLCCLINLQTLNIVSCNLHDFHFIGELKQLRFLRIRSYYCQELPKGMCNLSELRLLNLNDCEGLYIPPNVLSTLTLLEELHLFNCWRYDIMGKVAGYESLDELKRLSFLTNLEILIPNANVLPKGYFLLKKLERYKIYIDDDPEKNSFYMDKTSRGLKLNLKNSICSEYRFPSVEDFLSKLNSKGFPELEVLYVEESSCFRTVFDCFISKSCDPFPCLKSLILERLYKLEKIYDYQLKPESFHQLTTIHVRSCNELKNIFSIFSTNGVLPLLQDVTVGYCGNMEEIFAMGREEDVSNNERTDQTEFKRLCSLSLSYLPKLTNFCRMNSNEVCAPNPFFNQKDPLPNLEALVIDTDLKLILQCHFPEQLCCNVKSLKVRGDAAVPVVFPLGMLQRFRNLQELRLHSCSYQMLDSYQEAEILDPSVLRCDAKLDTVLHKIESLSLEFCRDLIQLVPSSVSFQNLTFLDVQFCSRLKNLVMSSTAKSLVQLREMVIYDCRSMIEVVAKEEDVTEDNIIFTKLRTLTLDDLPSLTCFCSGNYNFVLPSLEELNLNGCPQMKYFSSGDVTTPTLQKLREDWTDCKLEGDLNATIQQLQHSRISSTTSFSEMD